VRAPKDGVEDGRRRALKLLREIDDEPEVMEPGPFRVTRPLGVIIHSHEAKPALMRLWN